MSFLWFCIYFISTFSSISSCFKYLFYSISSNIAILFPSVFFFNAEILSSFCPLIIFSSNCCSLNVMSVFNYYCSAEISSCAAFISSYAAYTSAFNCPSIFCRVFVMYFSCPAFISSCATFMSIFSYSCSIFMSVYIIYWLVSVVVNTPHSELYKSLETFFTDHLDPQKCLRIPRPTKIPRFWH